VNVSFGQNSTFWGGKVHTGFIIPHSAELKSVSESSPYGIQFEWSKLKTSDKAWQTCNCYGRTGISLAYFNYNNPSQLGSSYNLNYFAEPYLTPKNAFKLSLRSSVGVSYLTQLYDEETNPENLFFSAPISFYLQLGLGLNYDIGDNNLNLFFNYNHISNGGQSQPNKGMNFPTVSIGYDYIINRQPLDAKSDILKAFDPQLWSYLVVFGSLRSADESSESSNFLRSGLSYGLSKPLSRISNLTAGIEVSFDGSYQHLIDEQGLDESPIVSAFLAGHQFSFGNIHFLTQFGFYLTRPQTLQSEPVYQNYSLWYFITPKVAVGTALIAYGHVADHMDARLVYRL
jgi:hypothetical protein